MHRGLPWGTAVPGGLPAVLRLAAVHSVGLGPRGPVLQGLRPPAAVRRSTSLLCHHMVMGSGRTARRVGLVRVAVSPCSRLCPNLQACFFPASRALCAFLSLVPR